VRQHRALSALAARLDTDPAGVTRELEEMRALLLRPENLYVQVRVPAAAQAPARSGCRALRRSLPAAACARSSP